MKGGKDDEKIMGPLFPRLHVNDTEKGGPRAPPRNKMALYEQLSIPSQRFNPGGPALPHPPHAANSSLPSASSSQGIGHEMTVLPSFYFPSTPPAHSTEKLCPRSAEGINVNNTDANFEIKSTTNSSSKPSNFKGQISQTAEQASRHLHGLSTSKTSFEKKYGDEDDFCVPNFLHSGGAPDGQDEERQTPLCTINPAQATLVTANSARKNVRTACNSSQLQDLNNKPQKRNSPSELKPRQHGRNTVDHSPKDIPENKSANDKTSSRASGGGRIMESLRCAKESLIETIPRDLVNEFENAGSLGWSHPEQDTARENVLRMRSKQGTKIFLANCYRDHEEGENYSMESEEIFCGSQHVSTGEGNDDSESSMVDCFPGMEISPDDVVGVIGPKLFWKARREIVNQQKAFAFQVFELHRLIKVQRLIAGSPHMLLQDYPFLRSPKVCPKKILPSENLLKSLPPDTKQKDDSQRMSQTTGCLGSNLPGKPPIPSGEDGVHRLIASQNSSCGPYMPNMPLTPMGSDNKAAPWSFPPWLVPVLSPSEGLVFKPYTGPCPPPGAFMPPVYGGCSTLGLPHMARDFMDHAYRVPAPQQHQVGVVSGTLNYYPPYGFPVMNPSMSTAAVEQVNMMTAARSSHGQDEQLSTGEANFNVNSRVSRNLGNRKREGTASSGWRPRSSKGSEVHGSTASSPCDNGQGGCHVSEGGNSLPLFPMAPAVEGSGVTPHVQSSNQQTRVIKVVPHNRRSASESAARIFQSIQEERQQQDSH
ncbi:protein HEADING DATE 3B-like [Aristolochia californica]|uniref:protein HEADING DATE 3B-like n=1 Tax=Aristolochia californica TaxID=171875 RepID=UPI0035DA6F74